MELQASNDFINHDTTISNAIANILLSSIRNLFTNQPDIFNFTPQTGETEWNLGHHLANEIHLYFPNLDCDLDVTKHNYNNKRPDIILHKRGSHKSNYLVIELKHRGSNTDEDIKKIKNEWLMPPLSYRYGASIQIEDDSKYKVEVVSKSFSKIIINNDEFNYVCIPKNIKCKLVDVIDIDDLVMSYIKNNH